MTQKLCDILYINYAIICWLQSGKTGKSPLESWSKSPGIVWSVDIRYRSYILPDLHLHALPPLKASSSLLRSSPTAWLAR
jgi:hypothetical protein